MYVNINGLKEVENESKNSIKFLNSAINFCGISEIPEDFSNLKDIKKIPSELNEIISNIQKVQATLQGEIGGYINAEKTNQSLVESLGVSYINTMQTDLNQDENLVTDAEIVTNLNNTQNSLYFYKDSDGNIISAGSKEYNEAINNNVKLELVKTDQYNKLSDSLINDYGLKDEAEVQKLIVIMGNNKEMNLYIDDIKKIVNQYKNDPTLFEKRFGFSLYKKDKLGQTVLNTDRIYVDLFIRGNLTNNLIINDSYGKKVINSDFVSVDKYMNASLKSGIDFKSMKLKSEKSLKSYLKLKKININ